MLEFVGIADLIIVTFGIPFLIAYATWDFKQSLTFKKELKLLDMKVEEYKKLSNDQKKKILKEISKIKSSIKN